MVGTIAEEGADRATFSLQDGGLTLTTLGDNYDWYTPAPNRITTVPGGDGASPNPERNSHTVAMIKHIMASAPEMASKVVLVLKDNAGVSLPDDPHILGTQGLAILEVWFPGQEDGNIVADLLFGVHNPSGKLPVTFPIAGKGFLDYIAPDPTYFPGIRVNGKNTVDYKEGFNIGYRWYDANVSGNCALTSEQINPCVAFPFGYGLSYTRFEITQPALSENGGMYQVTATVTNTGDRTGAEVVQVYVEIPAAAQPPKRLVGFHKATLAPRESQQVSITIDPEANNHPLGVYDKAARTFVNPTGTYSLFVGNSSSPQDFQRLTFAR